MQLKIRSKRNYNANIMEDFNAMKKLIGDLLKSIWPITDNHIAKCSQAVHQLEQHMITQQIDGLESKADQILAKQNQKCAACGFPGVAPDTCANNKCHYMFGGKYPRQCGRWMKKHGNSLYCPDHP